MLFHHLAGMLKWFEQLVFNPRPVSCCIYTAFLISSDLPGMQQVAKCHTVYGKELKVDMVMVSCLN